MEKLEGVEFYISKLLGKATMDYKMISDKDKIAVGVSGGKDSLALLNILLRRREFVPVKYDILAVHIDMGYPRSCARSLEKYFIKNRIKYHIEKVTALKKVEKSGINCFWCSWNRRKALFEVSDRLKHPKIALGHHKDDIIETILMNLFFYGEISSMRPVQELFKGKIKIIRPLAYVEEHMVAKYIKKVKIPVYSCLCPNSTRSNRHKVGLMIRQMEKICPDVKTNIFRSLSRIKTEYLL
jgi:tRNA 2-thiocytidine biosynthesis protein TtcA